MTNRSWLKIGCSFDMAYEYGIEEGIVLDYFIYEIHQKAANGFNYRKGRNWTYNTYDGLLERLPFKTRKPLMRVISFLEDKGLLVSGNFNKVGYDRTRWYSLSDECAEKYGVTFQTKSQALLAKNTRQPMSQTGHCEGDHEKSKENQGKVSRSIVPNGTMESPKRDNRKSQSGPPIPSSLPSSFSCSSSKEEIPTTTFSFPLDSPELIMNKYNCTELEARKAFDQKSKEKSKNTKSLGYNIIGLFVSKKITPTEFETLLIDWDNEYRENQQRLKEESEALERKRLREEKDNETIEILKKANARRYEACI